MESIRLMNADALEREEIEDARRMPEDVRRTIGVVLFDRCLKSMEAGIRLMFPAADDRTVHAMIDERLRLVREVDSSD